MSEPATTGQPLIRRNASWALFGQFAKLLIQMGYFVLIARVLKPSEYGAFVSVAALASAMSAFSGMGSGHLLIREVTRNRDRFANSWALALVFHFGFGTLFLLLLFSLSHWLLPREVSGLLILTVGISDLVFSRLIDLSVQSLQSVHDGRRMVMIQFAGSGVRLVGAVVLALAPIPKLAAVWGILYLLASVISSGFAVLLVTRTLGRPVWKPGKLRPQLVDGFHFATSLSAETIYNDIDKTMLARMSSLDAAAIYSVAYRFVEAATVPIRALAFATYPVFFEKGVGGIAATYRFAKTLLPKSVAYGLLASAGLFVLSPLIPRLMGPLYHDSAQALRWLCLLPLLRSVHAFLLDVLTGADRQFIRSSVQWAVALLNVAVNLWLIRAFSWKGASASSVLSDGALALGLEACILFLIRRAPQTQPLNAVDSLP